MNNNIKFYSEILSINYNYISEVDRQMVGNIRGRIEVSSIFYAVERVVKKGIQYNKDLEVAWKNL